MYDHLMFGKHLRYWRHKRGYTLRQLHELANVPFETISRMEHGHQQPSWHAVLRLATALHIKVDALALKEEDAPP